jgi:hypothetical protein
LKVTLSRISPPIWRQLLVRGDINLGLLHHVIQVAMGWTDSHLHQFFIGEKRYSNPSFELDDFPGEDFTLDEYEAVLMDLAPRAGRKIEYEYDFGDDWHHLIRVEKILAPDPARKVLAECIGGARACPPDDCGGAGGYQALLDALKHPEWPRYRELLEWLGGPFDSEAFDLDGVNRRLCRLK